MAYQIQNYLGEVIIENVSEEELEALKNSAAAQGYNYFEYDPLPEYDLVTKWAAQEQSEVNAFRIIKKIVV